jgi:hypothetical protein
MLNHFDSITFENRMFVAIREEKKEIRHIVDTHLDPISPWKFPRLPQKRDKVVKIVGKT